MSLHNENLEQLGLHVVSIDKPEDLNLILDQSHYIKAVEDLHERLLSVG